MKVCIVYIAVTNGVGTADFSSRFVASFHEHPPGVDADFVVCCNGGPLSTEKYLIFSSLNPTFFNRPNDPGFDISAYQDAALGPCSNYDAVLWLGESNYFHRKGWLKRLIEEWDRYGPGMYGPYASNTVRGHMNTSAFFCSPGLVRSYPIRAHNRQSRMDFEHGENALWRMASNAGMPTMMVTWDGAWKPREWRTPKNIIWRGDQSNCLMWCNHCDNFNNVDMMTRVWISPQWDQPFK